MTPAQLALVDQATAEFGAQVDALVETFNRLAERNGGSQALADICALAGTWERPMLAAIVSVAVGRLAQIGEDR